MYLPDVANQSTLRFIRLTSRYLIGSDGQPDGMIGEYQRIIHLRVP